MICRSSTYRSALLPFSLLLCFCLAWAGCRQPASDQSGLIDSEATQTESTRKMAALLKQIADETFANPRRNVHVNKARVAELSQVTPPEDPDRLISFKGTLGQEQLNAGYNEAAIETFESILDVLEENPSLKTVNRELAVKDYLAISYMRLGEQENCIENHNIERCLLPISKEGVHTKERGSRKAIEVYKEILTADPSDMNAVWLLNVAYMTLGEYPEAVPEKWRIPPEALASEYDIRRFPDVAVALDLNVVGLSGGAITEDFNNDGHLDIMASSWGLEDQIRLFLNNGAGSFTDRSAQAGLEGIVGGLNLVHADYDNDGYTDVFVLRGAWLGEGHPNSLLRNRGNGTFEDVTEAAGLLSFHPTQTASWGDFNNDGHLDLFVGNETSRQGGAHPGELFQNQGDGTFVDVAAAAGVVVMQYVKGVVWGDYNNDGLLDLYVSNWEAPNQLFRNEGAVGDGRWQFTDVAAEAGVQEPIISFPTWFWDYNNDGWLDIFVSGWKATAGDIAAEYLNRPGESEHPRLYRNKGDGTFEDVTVATHLDRVMYTMGSNFGDLDNDGFLDFYVGTGDPDFRSLMPNRMFRNAAGTFFQDVSASGGFGHLQKGHGVAFGDLDNDGDQDIYAVIGGAYEGDVFGNALFENPGHGHRWLTLLLEGASSNRSAIGARVRVEVTGPEGITEIHRVVGTGGSFGASSLQLEIGLGNASAIKSVHVFWPATKNEQQFNDLSLDAAYLIREDISVAELLDRKHVSFQKKTMDH